MTQDAERVAVKIARYVVVVERYIEAGGDSVDGVPVSGLEAVQQLAAELQEGWDRAGVAGCFHVTTRTIEDEMAYPNASALWSFADDPGYVRHNDGSAE